MWVLLMRHDLEEPIMKAITTIGLDIAKSVFQVHGIDVEGNLIIRRQVEAALRPDVLAEAAIMPGWH